MKIKKNIAIGLTAIGAVGSLLGVILLPVGCEYTISLNTKDEINMFYEETIVNDSGCIKLGVGASNYGDYKKVEIDGNSLPNSVLDSINSSNDLNKINYSDYVKKMRIYKKESKAKYDLGVITYNEYSLDEKLYNSVLSAYGMMVSGAVLFSIFTVVMIIGIVLLFLGKQNKKI